MSKYGVRPPGAWCLRVALTAALVAGAMAPAAAQETSGDPAVAAETVENGQNPAAPAEADPKPQAADAPAAADQPADQDEPAADEAADSSATVPDADPDAPLQASEADPSTAPSDDPDGDPATTSAARREAVDAAADAAEDAAADAAPGGMSPVLMGLLVVAVLVLPVLVGNYLAKRLRMLDYGWKLSVILLAITVASVVVSMGEFKFGPDLAGGITLVYELADTSAAVDEDDPPDDAAADEGESGQRQVSMPKLISALKQRIDPTSTREVTIREQGASAIEIIIPATGPDALEFVKRRITALGQLEFRITADLTQPDDRQIIEQARQVPPSQKEVRLGERKAAEWVPYAEDEFGPVDAEDGRGMVKRMAGNTPEILVLMDPWDVTGGYLVSASKGVGEVGEPAVHFTFNNPGARRFRQLTGENTPNPATGAKRYLGIILDKRLISAPSINSVISDQGQISGSAMTEQEVDYIVSVLDAGSLPAALDKTPISEEIISPTLGAETIQKGKFAIGVSFIAVVLFMIFYYRLAGVISVMALFMNLLLVLAAMVLINAAFTLPGLAGLVLVIGMAVDANVLIFERIRDEMRSGAALRMAIRNGFNRATTTIVDANLTTIIAGIVMYAVGRDQIKGFAVTLVLGIMMSMFTAVFCSRVVFDILERHGWIKTLKMNSIVGRTNINFMSLKHIAGVFSVVLIAVGMFAVYERGMGFLNIDFTGGSSVSFVLQESDPMTVAEVRDELVETDLGDKNLLVVSSGETNTRYAISTSEQSVESVKQIIVDRLGDRLLEYSFEYSNLQPFSESDVTGSEAKVAVNAGPEYADDDGVSHDALLESIREVIEQSGEVGVQATASNPNYRPGSSARYQEWTIRFEGADVDTARSLLERLESELDTTPMFPLASKIGGRVSAALQVQAMYAIGLSCVGIIGYIWLRFQQISFGLAAVVALVHDVLATIGILALSAYVVRLVPGVADALMLDSFQVSLDIVAALLTIIGYSVNDTIIVFDRIREVRGKSPDLTLETINTSINQTLARTILTSFTVFLVVVILYILGGAGIHDFAFALVVGMIIGTYSSIYVASPVLYWLSGTEPKAGPS